MRSFLLPALLLVCFGTASAFAPIRSALNSNPATPPFSATTEQLLGGSIVSTLGIATNRLATAKAATILLLLNGALFRFLDDVVLKKVLEMETPTEKDRSMVLRIGRRFLALGAAAFNLFYLKSSPFTAIGTCGAVLLLDRAKRADPPKRETSNCHGYVTNEGEIVWDRFADVFRLHLYSVLAWTGVLHPALPFAKPLTRVMGALMGVLAAKDIFFPDRFGKEDTNETALLCQSAGYAMAGLSLFVITASSSSMSNLSAMGIACIANLYSMMSLAPSNQYSCPTEGDATARPSLVGRLKKGAYFVWLATNGAIAAILASPGGSSPSSPGCSQPASSSK